MKRGVQLFLLGGCALVLVLEAPMTISALAAGWRGPYAGRVAVEGSVQALPAVATLTLGRLALTAR